MSKHWRAGLALAAIAAWAALEFLPNRAQTATDPSSATVTAPNIVSVTNTPVNAFASHTNDWAGRQVIRVMQNTGTQPVLYALGSTCATTNYHGVLAAGNATRDGLGSIVNLSSWKGSVSVMCETSSGTVVTMEILK